MKELRRYVVTAVIGSFSLAALMGILALLGAGEFGDGEARVLMTTVVVGIESVAMLCYLALAGHQLAAIGGVGATVSLVATASALASVWGSEYDDWKLLAVSVVVAATFAQASLLIALVEGSRYDAGLGWTLLAATVVATMVVASILNEDVFSDGYLRVLGIVAILDVLGTVVLIALGAVGRAVARAGGPGEGPDRPARLARSNVEEAAAEKGATSAAADDLVLEPAVRARLRSVAAQRGTSPSQIVDAALDDFLARS